ncbi:MAG: lanthionine synthetase C family protein, partial [Bacteroidota bacterium]
FYCAKYFDDDYYAETGSEIIANCIEKINSGYLFPTYCNGIAGFGWVLQHLVDYEFIELNLDELLAPFDDYLVKQMGFEFENGHFDMLHGGMGYGLYFLKRLTGKDTSNKSKEIYHDLLIRLVNFLEESAIEDNKGLKWESLLSREKEIRGFNLSLSHGISSIIYMLSKLHQANIEKTRTSVLIRGAIRYIEGYRKKNIKGLSLYPRWINPMDSIKYNSRLAWCYGDLGIGNAFEHASKALKDSELKNANLNNLIETSRRKNSHDTKVADAGYCHGSYGNAHIFLQLWKKYNDENFKDAAYFWLKDGLSRHTNDKQIPYEQYLGKDNTYVFKLSLLEGISGIGLTMIDFLSEEDHTWDECLMLR